jgi:hypothetical protein
MWRFAVVVVGPGPPSPVNNRWNCCSAVKARTEVHAQQRLRSRRRGRPASWARLPELRHRPGCPRIGQAGRVAFPRCLLPDNWKNQSKPHASAPCAASSPPATPPEENRKKQEKDRHLARHHRSGGRAAPRAVRRVGDGQMHDVPRRTTPATLCEGRGCPAPSPDVRSGPPGLRSLDASSLRHPACARRRTPALRAWAAPTRATPQQASEASGIRRERTGIRHERTGIRHERTGIRHERTGIRHERTGIRHERTGIRHESSSARGQASRPASPWLTKAREGFVHGQLAAAAGPVFQEIDDGVGHHRSGQGLESLPARHGIHLQHERAAIDRR